jgi:hypothetical protein
VVLLGSSLTSSSLVLGVGRDTTIGVETADNTVCFSQDLTTLFNERLDDLDEFLLVTFILGGTLSSVNVLPNS